MNTTVIVCSRNRSSMLSRLLRRLSEQTVPPSDFDVVVVDDASDDDTFQRLQSLRPTMPNLRAIRSPKRGGLAHSRNIGISATDAARILFTDDDCIPATDWVARMCDALDKEPIVAGAIASPSRPWLALCHNVAQFYAFLPCQREGHVGFIAGANMGMRREVLEHVGGFQQETPHAEDMEFILRAREAGYRAWFSPDAVVVHEHHRNNFGEVMRYASHHAESTILLRLRHDSILSTPSLLRHAPLLVILAPLIALKVTASAFLSSRGMLKYWTTIPIFYLTKLAWCLGAASALRRQRRGNATP